MAKTSFTGYLRQYGSPDKRNATPAVLHSVIQFTLNLATPSSTGTGKFLPARSIPLGAQNITASGEVTTVDIGFIGSIEAIANDLDAQVYTGVAITGSELGKELTEKTEITAGHGTGGAGLGNVILLVYYIMADDGKA